ncbi:hypothetical protein [Shewanella sp.]|uniref:hypothetical protein n=1 Tax=Shewanella sp. TaxID=50422 RepID=UPI003568C2F2
MFKSVSLPYAPAKQADAERENDDERYPCSCRLSRLQKFSSQYLTRAYLRSSAKGQKYSKFFYFFKKSENGA